MTDKKGHALRDLEKVKPGGVMVIGIIVTAVIAVFIAAMLEQDNTEIDPQKNVYLFLHGRVDLREKAETSLVAYGFPKEKIIKASAENVGSVGDYMAMLWRPPRPDHIKIQKITKVKEVEPDQIIGFWRGVSGKVIDTISLEKDKSKDGIHRRGAENAEKRKYI